MPELDTVASSNFFFTEREQAEAIQLPILDQVKSRIPQKLRSTRARSAHDIQVLCPMNRGGLGTRQMNVLLQESLNPHRFGEPVVDRFGTQFRLRDKVIQTRKNYDKDVFNGDIGRIVKFDEAEREAIIAFDGARWPTISMNSTRFSPPMPSLYTRARAPNSRPWCSRSPCNITCSCNGTSSTPG